MNWYKKAQNKKILIICRGISGSGKSTLAKQLGKGGIVLGSDDFFMINGKYEFDKSMQGQAHTWNQGRVREAMQQQITPIVVDNTNLQFWEMKPYVEMAQKFNYEVVFKEPTTPWKFDVEELAKRNTHGVPKEVIKQMVQNYQPNPTVEEVLKSERPKAHPTT